MTRGRVATAGAIAATVLAIGAGTIAYAVTNGRLNPPQAPPAKVAGYGPAAPPRVADLMTRAGCRGAMIGTQLYSRETARCTYRGGMVTLAAFTTNALRDQWVGVAKEFGGSFVVGQLWAAMVDGPDRAGLLATALGGRLG